MGDVRKEAKMLKYSRIFTYMAVLVMFLLSLFLVQGCIPIQKNSPEPMILLSNFFFRGEFVGVKVPARYGDFSMDESGFSFRYQKHPDGIHGVIECVHGEKHIMHQLFVLQNCPVPIVLRSYFVMDKDTKDWVIEYWIYKGLTPVCSTEEETDRVLMQDHKCPVSEKNV